MASGNFNKTKTKKGISLSEESQFEGRKPPQALPVEEAVLGALMLEKDAPMRVMDSLIGEAFYHDSNQLIFSAIRRLFEAGQPVDVLTVCDNLRSKGELEQAGGAFYITQLTNKVASSANLEFHSKILLQKYVQRELIRVGSHISQSAFSDTADAFELLDNAEKELFAIKNDTLKKNFDTIHDLIQKAINQLEETKDTDGSLTGVPSGFTRIDRVTGGWQKSDLIILAGRPGMGKTAFVLGLARNAAIDHNLPVAVFSLEMSSVQLVTRLMSGETELKSDKFRKGDLKEYEWEQLHARIKDLSEAPIYIDDTPQLSIFELRAKARRLKSNKDIQLLVIDYLQLMRGDEGNNKGNREQEISHISRSLKGLAKELEIPIIALAQLSRAVEQRNDKIPILSDLRESGSIEQDADMVGFLYRAEYYGFTEDDDGNPTAGMGQFIIAKNRHGETGKFPLRFVGEFAKFEDLPVDTDVPFIGTQTIQSSMNSDGGDLDSFPIMDDE